MTSVSLSAASAAEGPPATRRPLSARASRLHVRMLFLLRGVSSTSVEPVPHSSQRVTPVSSRYPECCVAPALRRPAPPCYAPALRRRTPQTTRSTHASGEPRAPGPSACCRCRSRRDVRADREWLLVHGGPALAPEIDTSSGATCPAITSGGGRRRR